MNLFFFAYFLIFLCVLPDVVVFCSLVMMQRKARRLRGSKEEAMRQRARGSRLLDNIFVLIIN